MKHTPLPDVQVDYIRDICRQTLEYICNKIQSISPNLVDFSKSSQTKTFNDDNKNGLLGYVLLNKNKNNPYLTSARQITTHERIEELKSGFFFNFEKKHKATVRRLILGRNTIQNRLKNSSSLLDCIEITSDLAIKNQFGCCDELSMVAIKFLMKNIPIKENVKVSLFHGANFRHRFIVIGLPDDCDTSSFLTWPDNVVILDAWLHCHFLLKDLPYYWRDMGYADNWAEMQSWDNISSIMNEKILLDESNLFFEKFVPELEFYFSVPVPPDLRSSSENKLASPCVIS